MNEFSILCRVLGSLYYRQPQDPLLVPLFTLIRDGKLAASWPLEQDELLERLQKSCDTQPLTADYNALFVGDECAVSPYRSAWVEGATEAEVRGFLTQHGIPTGDGPTDHIGSLLLAASAKIMPLMTKAKRWKRCLPITSYRGAAPSSVKSRRMRKPHSGVPWRYSRVKLYPPCGMSCRKKTTNNCDLSHFWCETANSRIHIVCSGSHLVAAYLL